MLKSICNAGYDILTYDQQGQGEESDSGIEATRRGKKYVSCGVGTTDDKISILRYLKDDEDTMHRCKLSSMDKLENTGKCE